jgi:Fibronectin type III domain
LSYTLRYAAIGADGKTAPWTELPPFSNTRSVSVNGLTPGTTYAFQVRALGRLGYTDWSDSFTRMSV